MLLLWLPALAFGRSDPRVEALLQRTHGWPAGLRLALTRGAAPARDDDDQRWVGTWTASPAISNPGPAG